MGYGHAVSKGSQCFLCAWKARKSSALGCPLREMVQSLSEIFMRRVFGGCYYVEGVMLWGINQGRAQVIFQQQKTHRSTPFEPCINIEEDVKILTLNPREHFNPTQPNDLNC